MKKTLLMYAMMAFVLGTIQAQPPMKQIQEGLRTGNIDQVLKVLESPSFTSAGTIANTIMNVYLKHGRTMTSEQKKRANDLIEQKLSDDDKNLLLSNINLTSAPAMERAMDLERNLNLQQERADNAERQLADVRASAAAKEKELREELKTVARQEIDASEKVESLKEEVKRLQQELENTKKGTGLLPTPSRTGKTPGKSQ